MWPNRLCSWFETNWENGCKLSHFKEGMRTLVVNLPLKLPQYLSLAPLPVTTIRHGRFSSGGSPMQIDAGLWQNSGCIKYCLLIIQVVRGESHYCWWSLGCWRLIMASKGYSCLQKNCHCFHSVKIVPPKTADIRPVHEPRSRMVRVWGTTRKLFFACFRHDPWLALSQRFSFHVICT